MSLQAQLVDLIQTARSRERTFSLALTDDERRAEGLATEWSAKDLIAHLADWRLRTAEALAAIGRGETAVDYPEFDEANKDVFERHRSKTWDEVSRFSGEAWAALQSAVGGMTDEGLAATCPLPSLGGRPVWRMVIIDAATHPLIHLGGYAARHGRSAEVTRWEEENAADLAALDSGPAWRGTLRYNLACHYALRGLSSKAMAALKEALRLNPDLAKWSQQDSDLDSLRRVPAYRALYEKP